MRKLYCRLCAGEITRSDEYGQILGLGLTPRFVHGVCLDLAADHPQLVKERRLNKAVRR